MSRQDTHRQDTHRTREDTDTAVTSGHSRPLSASIGELLKGSLTRHTRVFGGGAQPHVAVCLVTEESLERDP